MTREIGELLVNVSLTSGRRASGSIDSGEPRVKRPRALEALSRRPDCLYSRLSVARQVSAYAEMSPLVERARFKFTWQLKHKAMQESSEH